MIQIGTRFTSAFTQDYQNQRAQQKINAARVLQTDEAVAKLRREQAQQTAYLFRTASEKMRLLYENARAELASRQAKRAANGITDTSESAAVAAQQANQKNELAGGQVQADLQQRAARQEQETAAVLRNLAAQAAAYRRGAAKHGRIHSWGRALLSLFN